MSDLFIQLLPLLIVTGVCAGFLAGLLGVGGGTVLVPALFYIFTHIGYDPSQMMHMAVGTSLAIIVATGISSARAHCLKGAVRFDLARQMVPGMIAGVIAGTFLAAYIDGDSLRLIFAVLLLVAAAILFFDPAKFIRREFSIVQPSASIVTFFIGAVSALVGIGGAILNVPYMTISRIPIHQAVGTASLMGVFVAIPAAIGFMVIGADKSGLPPYSLGYVSLAAWATIVPFTMFCAPFGARLAHKLPVATLRRVFAIFLLFVAADMIYTH